MMCGMGTRGLERVGYVPTDLLTMTVYTQLQGVRLLVLDDQPFRGSGADMQHLYTGMESSP